MATTTNHRTLRIEDVVSVYSGRPGCCCGCRGKYYYASAHREAAGMHRGYKIDDDEISDRMVKKIFRAIAAAADVEVDGNHLFLNLGNRWCIAYLVDNTAA